MREYDRSKPLISIHIPKCAGTSFLRVLQTWYGRRLLRHYYNEKANRRPKVHRLTRGILRKTPRRSICIHGHFTHARAMGVRDYYPDCHQLITIIRDPFDLHVSNFFYVKQQAEKNRGGAYRSGKVHEIVENSWSLEEYLEKKPRSHLLQFLPPELTVDNYRDILDREFLFIGIAESLQESVDALAHVLGFPSVEVPVQNRSEWAGDIPADARARFQERNELEMLVYDYALSSFQRASTD
jgi:hypothetical protein